MEIPKNHEYNIQQLLRFFNGHPEDDAAKEKLWEFVNERFIIPERQRCYDIVLKDAAAKIISIS